MAKKEIIAVSHERIEVDTEKQLWGFRAGDIVQFRDTCSEVQGIGYSYDDDSASENDWVLWVKDHKLTKCEYFSEPNNLILLQRPSWPFKVGDRVRAIAGPALGCKGTVIVLGLNLVDSDYPFLVRFDNDLEAGHDARSQWNELWFPEEHKTNSRDCRWSHATALTMVEPATRLGPESEQVDEPLPVKEDQTGEVLAQAQQEIFRQAQDEMRVVEAKIADLARPFDWVKKAQEMLSVIASELGERGNLNADLPIFYPYGESEDRPNRPEYREAGGKRAKDEQEALHSIGMWLYHQITGTSGWTHPLRFFVNINRMEYPKIAESHRFAKIVNVLSEEQHEWNSDQVETALANLEEDLVGTRRGAFAKKEELEARIASLASATPPRNDSEKASEAGDVTQIRNVVKVARKILGKDKVISGQQVAGVWRRSNPDGVPIRYSEATLQQCARENASGATDWRLIYINGLSLREQREIRGTDVDYEPCFSAGATWWLESEYNVWTMRNPDAGYYLVNFQGQLGDMTWDVQDAWVAELGGQFERCNEAVFAEAIQTIFMVNDGERIAEDWYHWGATVTSSSDRRLVVGCFSATKKISIDGRTIDYRDDSIRVCVSRKWDF